MDSTLGAEQKNNPPGDRSEPVPNRSRALIYRRSPLSERALLFVPGVDAEGPAQAGATS